MRERLLEAFDVVRIDCLNGDKYKTGKVAPDGSPDPSIFSSREDPVGIQVGTGIATLVRRGDHEPAQEVGFRHLWGRAKRETLAATADAEPDALYEGLEPILPLGLPFAPTRVTEDWFDWPSLPDLFPVSFPGVKTSRDAFLVDIDLERLKARVHEYFDPGLSHEEIARRHPSVMRSTTRYDARKAREFLLARGGPRDDGFVRFAYRPFDNRWLYWERDGVLLDRPRPDYQPHVTSLNDNYNHWLSCVPRLRRDATEAQTAITSHIASLHLNEWGASMVPAWLRDDGLGELGAAPGIRANLSPAAARFLEAVSATVDDLFHHVLATLHDPRYRRLNSGALRVEWPRVPLAGWPEGTLPGAGKALLESANLGREIAHLLDLDATVPGVTAGALDPALRSIAVPRTTGGHNMTDDDLSLTARWGYFGVGHAVMPGSGKVVERALTTEERAALGKAATVLGDTTFDIHLNPRAYWGNVPAAVWNYKLGGYQVLKKWLSYREREVLGRPMRPAEVQHFTDSARRIAALLRLIATRE